MFGVKAINPLNSLTLTARNPRIYSVRVRFLGAN
jgi:hypothetical protein